MDPELICKAPLLSDWKTEEREGENVGTAKREREEPTREHRIKGTFSGFLPTLGEVGD